MGDEDRPVTKDQLNVALGRLVEMMAGEFTGVRTEVVRFREEMNVRLEGIDRRLDRISETTVALNRWADRLDRDNNGLHATQVAQQRAIDELSSRITKLERD